MSRRSSSPSIPIPPGDVHGTRRSGGSRREATERVRLRKDEFQTTGWTLNISRGGARVVLEESVELGSEYTFELGADHEPRDVRIIWTQDEADGQIVGVQFLDADGSVPPPPIAASSPPSSPVASKASSGTSPSSAAAPASAPVGSGAVGSDPPPKSRA